MWGKRDYTTGRDRSTNNWLVALLSMGEGWHNNHHAFPRSAYHGLTSRQIDFSAYVIRGLRTLRLVSNVYEVPKDMISARRDQAQKRRAA
jgi:stearoyl-CoA desaturase (delta-9 desaturase)